MIVIGQNSPIITKVKKVMRAKRDPARTTLPRK